MPGPARADPGRPAERPLPRPATSCRSRRERDAWRRSSTSTSRCRRPCEAHEPPEARGLARDEVRLMVAIAQRREARARALQRAAALPPTPATCSWSTSSAQIPAALPATRPDGTALELRLSTPMPDGRWLAELRLGPAPFTGGERGRAPRAAGRRARRARQPLRRRPAAVAHRAAPAAAARPLPRRARPADPLRLRVAGSGRSRPTGTSTRSSRAASSRRARAARSRASC